MIQKLSPANEKIGSLGWSFPNVNNISVYAQVEEIQRVGLLVATGEGNLRYYAVDDCFWSVLSATQAFFVGKVQDNPNISYALKDHCTEVFYSQSKIGYIGKVDHTIKVVFSDDFRQFIPVVLTMAYRLYYPDIAPKKPEPNLDPINIIANLCEVIKGNRGRRDDNPYCHHELMDALVYLAHETGFKGDKFDVDTKKLAEKT